MLFYNQNKKLPGVDSDLASSSAPTAQNHEYDQVIGISLYIYRSMTKQSVMCTQRRLRSDWADPPSALSVPSVRVFAVCSLDSEGPKVYSCGRRRLLLGYADAQADLSLRWVHVILLFLSCCDSYYLEAKRANGRRCPELTPRN